MPDPLSHDGPCYYCNKPTHRHAGNPGFWPVMLCHADDPGKVKHHHVQCVSERLAKVERLEAKLEQQRQNSIIRPLYDDMRRAESMKAAAKVIAELPTFSTWERELGSAAILAAAKDNANA